MPERIRRLIPRHCDGRAPCLRIMVAVRATAVALSVAPTSKERTPGTAASDASSGNSSIAPIGLAHASPSVVSIREEAAAPSFRRHFGQHAQPL
ncbi:hypothetical protein PR003_g10069 [Phytophthora rubi]|nr:hypothetical protein PR002_g11307 [Phytophthora rubi]KAE9341283.1 hypothetical protein PR003_g10069 [Phytophthora rubi]